MLCGMKELPGTLGLVSGTSTCHMLLSDCCSLVPGVWGPYYSALLEGLWLMEGGQSSTGSLLDFIIRNHPAYPSLAITAEHNNGTVYKQLELLVYEISSQQNLPNSCFLTKHFHMTADFHGNRSPLSDPEMTGTMVGLTLAQDVNNLALHYLGIH